MPMSPIRSFRAEALRVGIVLCLLATVALVTRHADAAFSDQSANDSNSLSSLACFSPAQPSSVQSGTASSTAEGTVSVAVTPVDPAMSFLVFSTRHNSARPVGSMLRGKLNATGDAVEFVRVTNESSPVTISIRWYVVEYACGVRVQRGEVSQTSTTVNVTLSQPVSTGDSFVLWSKTPVRTDNDWSQDDPIVSELTGRTTLQFRSNQANASHVIAWQVVEFIDPVDVTVQRGTTSLTGTNLSTTVALGTPVDVDNAFILVDYRTGGTGADVGARMLTAELVDTDTISISRSISGSPDDITEISWQAVELSEGSLVQRGNESLASSASIATVSISRVNTEKAYAFGSVQAGSGQNTGKSPYSGNDIVGVGSFTAAVAADNLTLRRTNTAASSQLGWFVVYWDPPPSISAVSPSSGAAAGGTSVAITGSGFTGATAVKFGSQPAASFTVDSDTQITAVTPSGSGAVDVSVTTPNGTNANTAGDNYTFGTIYYVRTDGADTNTGLSNTAGGAWKTIQKAASAMVAGDMVRVQRGVYAETVTPANAGSANNEITYLAEGTVTIDGGNTRCKAFDLSADHYLVIDGFEITNQPDCGGTDAAVDVADSNNVVIRDNTIHDTGRDAIYFKGTSANGLVENNLIYNIDDDGSTPIGGGGHTYRNNTFAGTVGGWTLENGNATNVFENNIFWAGTIQDTSLGTYSHNDYNGGVLGGTGNISSDPLFVNAATNDYRLSHTAAGQGSNSPAIDAGSGTAANLGLDTRTTRSDSVTDSGTVDLGYHYPT